MILRKAPIHFLCLMTLVLGLGHAADPEFYTPERDRVGKEARGEPLEPGLPKVLLIGDSIMGGYYQGTRRELKGQANVVRHPGNAGDTQNGLKKLDGWLADVEWDVIHFNWGLHDLCYRHPDSKVYGNRDKINGTLAVPLEDYGTNLEQLVGRLNKTGAILIFATTTKVPEGEAGRKQGDDVRYNKVAVEIMKKHGIPINDLHALTADFAPGMYSKPADVHFSGAGCAALAKQVAAAIRGHGLAKAE